VLEPFFPRSSGLEEWARGGFWFRGGDDGPSRVDTQETIDIMLLPLQSTCAWGNITKDHLYFADAYGPGVGEPGNALWTDDLVHDPVKTSLMNPSKYIDGAVLQAHNRKVTMYSALTTEANKDYVFSFQVIPPAAQSSP
jgi:hypothetical protein